MSFLEEQEIIRVCGLDYGYYDIPPDIRNRENGIIIREINIPIIQTRENYTNAAADYAEIINQ